MNLFAEVSAHLGEEIVDSRSLSGGCIAQTYLLVTASGKEYFLKSGADDITMFAKEANGLRELAKANALRIPAVYEATPHWLLLEYIPQGRPGRNFFRSFGEKFAEMHRYSGSTYGFSEDNFIGATPQLNQPSAEATNDWCTFYWENRLLPQFYFAEKRGFGGELQQLFAKLEGKITDIIGDSEEFPALLHGDLWSGNFLVDKEGEACIIDPAVYYGHREADLAMTRLFGGFDEEFYRAYNEAWPLPAGYEYRENLYKLYHVLNHLNLFGSGYLGQSIRLVKSYV